MVLNLKRKGRLISGAYQWGADLVQQYMWTWLTICWIETVERTSRGKIRPESFSWYSLAIYVGYVKKGKLHSPSPETEAFGQHPKSQNLVQSVNLLHAPASTAVIEIRSSIQ